MTASQAFSRRTPNMMASPDRQVAPAKHRRLQPEAGDDAPAAATGRIVFDAQAIDQAVGSLHETLARCEHERQQLVSLMDDARRTSPAGQLRQWSEADRWISLRLAELHAADDALARREGKLQKLQENLQQLSTGLAGQLEQLAHERQAFSQEQQDNSRRMLDARRQLEQQQGELDRQLASHEARVSQLNQQLDAKLQAIEDHRGEAEQALHQAFEKMMLGVVNRLEAVRKPMDKWLHAHLARYEKMLSDCLEAHELPVAQRIEAISSEVDQAIAPIMEKLDAAEDQITFTLTQADEKLSRFAAAKYDEHHEQLARQMDALRASLEAQLQQAGRDVMAGLQARRLTLQQQMAQLLVKCERDCQQQLEGFDRQLAEHGKAGLAKAQATLDQGVDNLGGKAMQFRQWFEKLHKHLTGELETLMAHVQEASRQATEQLDRHEQELAVALPARMARLMEESQRQLTEAMSRSA